MSKGPFERKTSEEEKVMGEPVFFKKKDNIWESFGLVTQRTQCDFTRVRFGRVIEMHEITLLVISALLKSPIQTLDLSRMASQGS
jgi:hypothetical protein